MTTAFDAIAIGERYDFGSCDFTAERIKDFARLHDPQPFHVDEAAAADSAFGGLIASGWQTALAAIRLQADHLAARAARGEAVPHFGAWSDVDTLRWMKPVYAGDRIAYSGIIRAKRPPSARPGWGLVTIDYAGVNQKSEPVFTMTGHIFVAV